MSVWYKELGRIGQERQPIPTWVGDLGWVPVAHVLSVIYEQETAGHSCCQVSLETFASSASFAASLSESHAAPSEPV